MATHLTTGRLVRWREIFLEAGGLGVHLVVVVLHDLTIVRRLGRCGLGVGCCIVGRRRGRQPHRAIFREHTGSGRRGHGGRWRRCRCMILHDHRITSRLLVRHGANARRRHLPRRHQRGRRGWLRWRRDARLAGMIDQTYDQCLLALAIDRRHRQLRQFGLHLVPQHQREQCVQYQYQRQHERQHRARQRWLSPALATQGLARFAVE
jgi:hypothetical protein